MLCSFSLAKPWQLSRRCAECHPDVILSVILNVILNDFLNVILNVILNAEINGTWYEVIQ